MYKVFLFPGLHFNITKIIATFNIYSVLAGTSNKNTIYNMQAQFLGLSQWVNILMAYF